MSGQNDVGISVVRHLGVIFLDEIILPYFHALFLDFRVVDRLNGITFISVESKFRHLTEASIAINIISAIIIVSLMFLYFIERHGKTSIFQKCSKCNSNGGQQKNDCDPNIKSRRPGTRIVNGQPDDSSVIQQSAENAYYEKLRSPNIGANDIEEPYEVLGRNSVPKSKRPNRI